jgi:hypothetical protein
VIFISTSPSGTDDPNGPQPIFLTFPYTFLVYSISSSYSFGCIHFQTGHNNLGPQLTGVSLVLAVFIVLSIESRSKAVLWRCLPGNKAKQHVTGVVREAVVTQRSCSYNTASHINP